MNSFLHAVFIGITTSSTLMILAESDGSTDGVRELALAWPRRARRDDVAMAGFAFQVNPTLLLSILYFFDNLLVL